MPAPRVDFADRFCLLPLMDYTQFFRSLREAADLGLEELASRARVHRNTIVNIESGRPVKFKTIAGLMQSMGYTPGSAEMKSMALLWLESVSKIPFSRAEPETTARKTITSFRSPVRQAARELEAVVGEANLTTDQIRILMFAAREPEVLSIIERIQTFARAQVPATDLKAAEDPADYGTR